MPSIAISLRFKRIALAVFLLAFAAALHAAPPAPDNPPKPGEPTDAKARKTFAEAVEWQNRGNRGAALDSYRKANKQDGGHCAECVTRAFNLAIEVGDLKSAETIVRDQIPLAATGAERAILHFRLALALQRQGIKDKKDKCFSDSCDELKTALQLDPAFAAAHYTMGVSLAYLHQDDAARNEFSAFLAQDKEDPSFHERAERFVERVDLARARMAPPFSVTTIDGRQVSLDSLAGKVVLIDFWATWCGPCREALPHIKEIAHRFEGQPLVVLSVSLDDDDAQWKQFVAKHGMTWLQYRDGRFVGPIAREFDVNAIPATFTIDADGVLEDQHVGDADIEGKLKKLIARAQELADRKTAPAAPAKPAGAGS